MRLKNEERVTKSRIDVQSILAETDDPGSGGTVLFIGTVRKDFER